MSLGEENDDVHPKGDYYHRVFPRDPLFYYVYLSATHSSDREDDL